jgi:tungstate transport system ATP-binding protein
MGMNASNIEVRRGSFVLNVPAFFAGPNGTALLGPNGAGKTTLLLVLAGLIASAGDVERPRRIATVFARPAVLRGTTLWNVSTVVRSVLDIDAAESDDRARTALDGVGLRAAAHAEARTLSTGERQRLALARALACEPQALFVDEPFANVDADARPALRTLVATYCARSRCDLTIATSSLADVLALCAETVVLNAGSVAYQGRVQELSSTRDPYVLALIAESRVPL